MIPVQYFLASLSFSFKADNPGTVKPSETAYRKAGCQWTRINPHRNTTYPSVVQVAFNEYWIGLSAML